MISALVSLDGHLRLFIFTGLLTAMLLLVASPWLAAAEAEDAAALQQVVNQRGDVLGAFGGLEPTININGELVSGMTVITATGYMVQLTNDGEVGLLSPVYFSASDCSGEEFLSPVKTPQSTVVFNGIIYRSLASGQIRYIEQYSRASPVRVRSRAYFDEAGVFSCDLIESDREPMLLASAVNDEVVTGYSERFGATAIAIRNVMTSAPERGMSPLERMLEGASNEPEEVPLGQQECSPGCTWQNLGNNSCNVNCYSEACNYDGGDCDSESQEFIQAELAKMCSPGCRFDDLADGFCDSACNNSACEFDRGDCSID